MFSHRQGLSNDAKDRPEGRVAKVWLGLGEAVGHQNGADLASNAVESPRTQQVGEAVRPMRIEGDLKHRGEWEKRI